MWAWPTLAVASSASSSAGFTLCAVPWTELAGRVLAEATVSLLPPSTTGRQVDARQGSGGGVSGQVLCLAP